MSVRLATAERRRAALMAAAVAALHVVGFGILFAVVAPQHLSLGASGGFGVGVGITAYTLGLRHALDADHIAAIDNTTRKLMQDGQRPLAVGFFFSLGHATVVFALALLLGFGVRSLAGPVTRDGSPLHGVAGTVGTTVSGSFLLLIAALNLVVLVATVRVFRRVRAGGAQPAELEERLAHGGGVLTRVLGRFGRAVDSSWKMYPLGVLFGLGFDTATEIALLLLAGGAAAGGLPWYAVLCLPVLFAAGMTLLDTLNGCGMTAVYGWAFDRPVRRVFYNLTVTGLSVGVALVIGTIELASVLAERLHLRGDMWDAASAVDLNAAGYVVVALFAAIWLAAVATWHLGRIEERWALPGPSDHD